MQTKSTRGSQLWTSRRMPYTSTASYSPSFTNKYLQNQIIPQVRIKGTRNSLVKGTRTVPDQPGKGFRTVSKGFLVGYQTSTGKGFRTVSKGFLVKGTRPVPDQPGKGFRTVSKGYQTSPVQ